MYRFYEIVGQEGAIEHLQNSLLRGSVSHAYIINGEKGSGKEMLARTYAAALQCEHPVVTGGRREPCGECRSCLQVMSGNQPDIIVWPRKKPPKYSVRDDIRPFLPDVQIRPYQSPWKIYLFEDADQLGPASQNALLKTLEEPPSYALFLLLANGTDNFLPTVLSRCITLQMRQVPEQTTAAYLMGKKGIDENRALLCARFSRGNIGRALDLAGSTEFAALLEESTGLLAALPDMDASRIAAASVRFGTAESAGDFLELVLTWYRDVLVFKSTAGRGNIIFSDAPSSIKRAADRLDYPGLQRIMEAVQTAQVRIKSNVNAAMALESMLLQIRASYRPGEG